MKDLTFDLHVNPDMFHILPCFFVANAECEFCGEDAGIMIGFGFFWFHLTIVYG